MNISNIKSKAENVHVFIAYPVLFLAGVMQTYAVCSPLDAQTRGWLQVVCLAVMIYLLEDSQRSVIGEDKQINKILDRRLKLKKAFTYSAVFSCSWLAATFWWIYISLHTFGGLPSLLAVGAVLILAAGLSIYYAVVCSIYSQLHKPLGWTLSSILFGCLWTLADLARAQWFTGFPWAAIGYAHLDNPLKLLAPYVGVYGVGLLAAALACVFSKILGALITSLTEKEWINKFSWRNRVMAAVLMVVLWPNQVYIEKIEAIRDEKIEFSQELSYTLLQGNVAQDIKFEAEGLNALKWYKNQIMAANTQLIVTPETALPVLKRDLPQSYWDDLLVAFSQESPQHHALLLGMVGEDPGGYTNRVVGIAKGSEDYVYDKHHLVPFGEFIPAWFKWFTDLMKIPLGSFKRGALAQAPWEIEGQRIAINICYEDVFGEELAQSFVLDPKEAPTLMVNVSNIGWFGTFWAVEQHLNASRMRALEMQRPMLRATNTGATAAIDHNGYVVAMLPKGEVGVLKGSVRGVIASPTPYAQWSGAYSLYPLWGLCLTVLAAALCRSAFQKKES